MSYKLEEENGIWYACKPGEPKMGFMAKDDAIRWIDRMSPKMEYKVLPPEPKNVSAENQGNYQALKKVLLQHHANESYRGMQGSAICYCGAGGGRTQACADFGELLDKAWTLEQLDRKSGYAKGAE